AWTTKLQKPRWNCAKRKATFEYLAYDELAARPVPIVPAVQDAQVARLPHITLFSVPMNRIEFDRSELLRFITAGSVDGGKSTLIGRLLHDSKAIFEDQLAAVERTTRSRGLDGLDLSLLTDGLVAEREQGITIDVAHRYFSTPKRKFIIADTPGHEQYTRNMVTGASTANLAVILIDARNGVVAPSRLYRELGGHSSPGGSGEQNGPGGLFSRCIRR